MQRYFLKCGDRNNLQSLVQTSGQLQSMLGNSDEQVGANRRPDLDGHTVGVGREESTQAQVLLDPPKEQLDLPAALVDRGDDQGRNAKLLVRNTKERLLLAS